MPLIELPLNKGTGVDGPTSRHIDLYNFNFVYIPKETDGKAYYLRNFPGVTNLYTASGKSFAAEYNRELGHEYRIIGSSLYQDGKKIADLTNPALANTAHTAKNQAFVDNGTLKFWDGKRVNSIKNWSSGENFVVYPDYKYIVDFPGTGSLAITPYSKDTPFIFNATVDTAFDRDFDLLNGEIGTHKYKLSYIKDEDKFVEIVMNGSTEERREDKGASSDFLNFFLNATYASNGQDIAIPITRVGGAGSYFKGKIEEFVFSDTIRNVTFSTIAEVERDSDSIPLPPTTRTIKSEQNDNIIAKLDSSLTWVAYKDQLDPDKSEPTNYDLSGVLDVDRHRSRFVFVNKRFFLCTAISQGSENDELVDVEHRPDYLAAESEAQTDPDGNLAVRSYNDDALAIFGRNTTEFFELTGNPQQIYAPIRAYKVACGIVATAAVCRFMGEFAAIGSSAGMSPQIMMIKPGQYKAFSTATIDFILNSYTESELQNSHLEAFNKEQHQFLVVHLPNHTLIFDGSTGQWSQLSTGYGRNISRYQGSHIVYNPEIGHTIAHNGIGKLDDYVSSQNGEIQEHVAYTPLIRLVDEYGATKVNSISFDSIRGHNAKEQVCFLSSTRDGYTYEEQEFRIDFNQPLEYFKKTVQGPFGVVQQSIGFKLNIVTGDNLTLSKFLVTA